MAEAINQNLADYKVASDNQPKNRLIGVVLDYLKGQISPEDTLYYLTQPQASAEALLWGGEIALENAATTQEDNRRLALLQLAHKLFLRSVDRASIANNRKMDGALARANLRISQLPLHSILILSSKLPKADLADKVLDKSLTIGLNVANALFDTSVSIDHNRKTAMVGVLSEIAVYSLLVRQACQIGTESWFPFMSHFSEDRRNRRDSIVDKSWDISVFSDTSPTEPSHKVQVKTTYRASLLPPDDGISLVIVNPDLKIPQEKSGLLSQKIILECFQERQEQSPSKQLVETLSARTDKLLSAIDE